MASLRKQLNFNITSPKRERRKVGVIKVPGEEEGEYVSVSSGFRAKSLQIRL